VRAIAAVYLLAPQIPMLFMGEEWAAAQPFPFFCDFAEELAEAVRKGRRAEFARFPEFQDEKAREQIPDPTAEETFRAAKLAWGDRTRGPHAEWLVWYQHILAVRRTEVVPRLAAWSGHAGEYALIANGAFRIAWELGDRSRLVLVANLAARGLNDTEASAGRVIWSEGRFDRQHATLDPWSVVWSIENQRDHKDNGS
jgi:1,4-alpha-glucan branching enzyme